MVRDDDIYFPEQFFLSLSRGGLVIALFLINLIFCAFFFFFNNPPQSLQPIVYIFSHGSICIRYSTKCLFPKNSLPEPSVLPQPSILKFPLPPSWVWILSFSNPDFFFQLLSYFAPCVLRKDTREVKF